MEEAFRMPRRMRRRIEMEEAMWRAGPSSEVGLSLLLRCGIRGVAEVHWSCPFPGRVHVLLVPTWWARLALALRLMSKRRSEHHALWLLELHGAAAVRFTVEWA